MLDLLIKRARVLDGTGNPWRLTDVGVESGRITCMGDLGGTAARESVDADGRCLTPGFIDIHTHSDFTLLKYPRAENMIAQGVTTEVTGNCGLSPFPVAPERLELLQRYTGFVGGGNDLTWDWNTAGEFFEHLESLPLAHNVACLVGHGTVRVAAMGFDHRPPTPAELAVMQRLVAEAMEAGAVGLSSGLIYSPGMYAGTEELVALCREVRRYGGFYATHIRSEADGLVAAVDEALAVGREAGVPVQLSHHKAMGERNWGTVEVTLAMVDAARRAGQDVTLDQYPYTGSSTTFTSFLPGWAMAGGVGALLARLADPAQRERIREETEAAKPMGWEKVLLARMRRPEYQALEGLTLAEAGARRNRPPLELGLDLLLAEEGPFSIIRFGMSEADVRRVMRHPLVMAGSDSSATALTAEGKPHPRTYGTFARILGHYVRETENLALAEAVRKMTSLPAQRLGLWDRGKVAPGCVADLVLLRPEAVADRATFAEPNVLAVGVDGVWVGGQLVWDGRSDTGARAGRLLRRAAN